MPKQLQQTLLDVKQLCKEKLEEFTPGKECHEQD